MPSPAAHALLARLDFSHAEAVQAFGLQQQRQHLAFMEATVQHLQAGWALSLQETLAGCKGRILAVAVEKCQDKEARPWALFLRHIPVLGACLAAQFHSGQALVHRFVRARKKLSQQVQALEEGRAKLLQHSSFLERLAQQQQDQVQQLELLIVAAELKLAGMEEDFFCHQQSLKAQNGVDTTELEALHSFEVCIQVVAARLHNLKQSHAAALVFAPALQAVQEDIRAFNARLEDCLALLPAWKEQMLLFISHLDFPLAQGLAALEAIDLSQGKRSLQESRSDLRQRTQELLQALEQGMDLKQGQRQEQHRRMDALPAALARLQTSYQEAKELLRIESA